MPDVIVIAGPNGAGKSTLAPALLRDGFGIVEYVNADTIAQGLSAFAPETAAIEAGRVMLKRLDELANGKKTFAFETTLATRFYSKWLPQLKEAGYNVHVIFLWLNSAELAIARVAERVRKGGHNIPTETIRRRYDRGLENFFKLYRPIADSWQFIDASNDFLEEIAMGDKIEGEIIVNETLWRQNLK